MSVRRIRFTFLMLMCLSVPLTASAQIVNIPDDNLRAAIENALGKTSGATITPADMERFVRYDFSNANIRDLTGLEYATNLEALSLGAQEVAEGVFINSNSIRDLSPLAGLTKLTELRLESNSIFDISPLAGLTNLTRLLLWGNFILDISTLKGLNKLTYLDISSNYVSDISSLSGLTDLTLLGLDNNSISDISPLVANTGLGSGGLLGDLLSVTQNPLSYSSLHTHIPALERRGATVFFDPRTPVLQKISGVVTASSDSTLIVEVRDTENDPFEGVPVTFTVASGGGTLSVTNTTTDENGRAESVLTPGTDGVNSVEVSAAGAAQTVTFTQVVVSVVNIRDANLRAALENELGKTSGATITTVDMEALTELRAPNADITDLTGLEAATNLRNLHLGGEYVASENRRVNSNSISDISSLMGLIQLISLNLDGNSIQDISPLTGLTKLQYLYLSGNSIQDISPLAQLTNLEELNLVDNSISDISPVSGLNKLTIVSFAHNSVSNISPLAQLTNLEELYLRGNSISDISPVARLSRLIRLNLWGNLISDISPVTGLNNLAYLHLDGNSISDISPVEGLNNLWFLTLSTNSISDISPLEELTNLISLRLDGNSISDISPLVANTGLGRGDTVNVKENPLNAASINTHIPALQSRGVTVEFDAVVAEPVDIPDDNLRAKIEEALGKTSGATITTADMTNLTELDASDADVTDLTGLETATNLTSLYLSVNSIFAISPVAGLTNLTDLDLSSNPISDISPLSGLTNLTDLELSDTPISDISPVAGLTNLTSLGLWYSSVSDLSPLVENMGLGEGDWVDVTGNPLNQESVNTHIPALQRRGVTVESDAVVTDGVNITDPNLRAAIERELGKTSGATITTADLATLTELEAPAADITDLTGLEHATQLNELLLSDNQIRDVSPLAKLPQLDWLILRNNQISDVSPLAELTRLEVLTLNDNQVSDVSSLAALTKLRWLDLQRNQMSDLSSVAGLTRLTWLTLSENQISDVSPLAGMTQLTHLWLDGNDIRDVSPLANLVNLKELRLAENPITDTSPLANLPNLVDVDVEITVPSVIPDLNLAAAVRETLALASSAPVTEQDVLRLTVLHANDHQITDLAGLEHATQLTELSLASNQISDISAIEGLTQLTELVLDNNQISDLGPLATLTKLSSLGLRSNQIRDISPIEGLTQLTALDLFGNNVSDISPLAGLVNLNILLLAQNPITHTSPLASLPNLVDVDVEISVISDPKLAVLVRATLGLAPTVPITTQTIQSLTSLFIPNSGVTHLTGLEHATQLQLLILDRNQISDLSPLAGLTQLENLSVGENQIQDVSPLTGLVQLERLVLNDNQISDVIALAGLTQLSHLWLNGNDIRDVSPLTGLVNLEELKLAENPITDTSPLRALLRQNPIVKIDIEVREAEDVNSDGIVNILDLVFVASNLGQSGENIADVNGDGGGRYAVNILDLVSVAGALGNTAAAPSSHPQALAILAAADVQQWLSQAQQLNLMDSTSQGGIRFLDQLLSALSPKETALLPNYPNPFNPETWIPYQLAKPADVTLTIYTVNGQLVRRFSLGHQLAGNYYNKNRAVYWDGRASFGETVASGVYYYHLSAGEYSAARRMLIIK